MGEGLVCVSGGVGIQGVFVVTFSQVSIEAFVVKIAQDLL